MDRKGVFIPSSIAFGIDEAAPATSWLTTGEASRRLAMSSQWARVQATRGVLRTVSTPLGLLFDPESVDELARARDRIRAALE